MKHSRHQVHRSDHSHINWLPPQEQDWFSECGQAGYGKRATRKRREALCYDLG
ncbi:unnamed protein product [Ectocarpus sp. 8 AP-2014]